MSTLFFSQPPTLQRSAKISNLADTLVWDHTLKRSLPGRMPVFVRAKTKAAALLLNSFGIEAKTNTWALAQLNDSQLLTALQANIEIRAAPAHKPMLDVSVPEIGADLVHQGLGVKSARTGKGVLVGVVDTGIDLDHPAFWQAGKSRVIAVWDQDAPAYNPPEGFDYGDSCTQTQIQMRRCSIGDRIGHGTHVTGIAAGSYSPVGVAPEADIALVRSDAFTRLADAVLFLVSLADKRRQPLVVNISVGGQYGPHDGRTPLEQYLGSLAGPGRLLVAAAGNDGLERVHVGVTLAASPVRVGFVGIPYGVSTSALVELWTVSNVDLDLAFEVWDNNNLLASAELDASPSETLSGSVQGYADITYTKDYLSEHSLWRHTLLINCQDAEPLPPYGTLALRFSGKGQVHGWISQTDYFNGNSRFGPSLGTGWIAGDSELSITVPSTSPNILSIGSYVTRTQWQSEFDGQQSVNGATVHALAAYSGHGPSFLPEITGLKPDLCAPGSVIASARSQSILSGANTVDAYQVIMQGTSMSAPHVTGTLALMLQADPRMSPKKAANLLKATARADSFTGEVPNSLWGYGKLDAQAAVNLAEQEKAGCMQVSWQSFWTVLLLLLYGVKKINKINKLRRLT